MRSLIKGARLPIVLALFLIIVIAIPALAEEKDRPRAELSVAVLSQYIWRGQELTRNSIVVQPSITVAYKGFYVNLWSNLDTKPYSGSDANYSTTWTETDFKLAYSKNLGLVKVEAGYGYYGMSAPNPDAPDLPDTRDIFLELGLNTLLSPIFSISKDVSHDHQWYLLLEIFHAFQFTRTVSLNISASASYLKSEDASTYPEYDDSALPTGEKYDNFHDGVISACLPISVGEYLTVAPTISYVFPLCDDARNEMKVRGLKGITPADRDSSFLYGGLILTTSF